MVLQVTQKTWPSQLSHLLRCLSTGRRVIYRRKRRILTLWSINVTQRSWKPQYGSGYRVILCTWQTCIPMSNMKYQSVTRARATPLLNLSQRLNSVRLLRLNPGILFFQWLLLKIFNIRHSCVCFFYLYIEVVLGCFLPLIKSFWNKVLRAQSSIHHWCMPFIFIKKSVYL